MHVLLPYTKEHEPWLISDALPRKGSDGKSPRISLADRNIDLSSLYSPTLLEGVPAGVASLAPTPVPRGLLSDKEQITTLVSFTAGRSHLHRCARGATWEFRKIPQQLAIRVVWTLKCNVELPLKISSRARKS